MSDKDLLAGSPAAVTAAETASGSNDVLIARRHAVSAPPGSGADTPGIGPGRSERFETAQSFQNDPVAFGPPLRSTVGSTAALAISALVGDIGGLSVNTKAGSKPHEERADRPIATDVDLENQRRPALRNEANECRHRSPEEIITERSADGLPEGGQSVSPTTAKTNQCIAARVAAAVKAAETPHAGDSGTPKSPWPSGADNASGPALAPGMDVGDLLQELSDLAPAAVEHTPKEVSEQPSKSSDLATPFQTPPHSPTRKASQEVFPEIQQAPHESADELCLQLERLKQQLSEECHAKEQLAQAIHTELEDERQRQEHVWRSEARSYEECSEELMQRNTEIRHLYAEVEQRSAIEETEVQVHEEFSELRGSAAQMDGQAIWLQDGGPPQNFEAVEAHVAAAAEDSLHAREQLEIALKELRAPSPPLLMSSGEQPKGGELRYFRACQKHDADLQVSLLRSDLTASGSGDKAAVHASNLVWLRDPLEIRPELASRTDSFCQYRNLETPPGDAALGAPDEKPPIQLLLFTWNMGEHQPIEEEIEHWLPLEGESFDMVVVGLQESTYKVDKVDTHHARNSEQAWRPRASTVTVESASLSTNPFPQTLGPFGVSLCQTLPTVDRVKETYEMPHVGLVSRLADARVHCGGSLSPPSRFSKEFGAAVPWIPPLLSHARTFCWAYPTDAGTEEYSTGLSHSAKAEIQSEPDCAFLLFGGFVYFDETGACIAAQAVCPGNTMHFDGPFSVADALGSQRDSFVHMLRGQNRLHPVAMRDLWAAGAREFAWLLVGEEMGTGGACSHGGFVFFFDEESDQEPCYFTVCSQPGVQRSTPSVATEKKTWKVHDAEDSSSDEEPEVAGHHFLELVSTRLGCEWRLVRESHLMQMRLAVFARTHLAVTHLESSWCATGLGNMVGNKGGVVVGLEVRGTSICFVNSHLAAHPQFCDRRHEDIRHILRQARVRHKGLDLTMQYDHCFWFGDLNYRLDVPGSDRKDISEAQEFVHRMIRDERHRDLFTYDQLSKAHSNGHIFFGFEEGCCDFPPTFKVKRQAGTEYLNKRLPAYCDRVLWKSLPHRHGAVHQSYLSSVPQASTSDHKPLCTHFVIQPTCHLEPADLLKADSLDDACAIYILRLEAEELSTPDSRAKVNPLVVFHSVPACVLNPTPLGARQTKVKSRTAHPQWGHTEVPVLRPAVRREALIQVLRRTTLVLDVLDHEQFTKDEALGTALVSLVSFESASARTVSDIDQASIFEPPFKRVIDFWAPLVCGNRQCGKIHGKLALYLGEDAALRASAGKALHTAPPSRGRKCCSIS